MKAILSCAVGAVAMSALLQPAFADDLKIAFSAPATTLDPHFQNASQNIGVSRNIFEALVQMDPDSRIVPGLAESWRRIDDKTWEFKLRRAKFDRQRSRTARQALRFTQRQLSRSELSTLTRFSL
jgi:peptide/nickel transport system substrate-binding protein